MSDLSLAAFTRGGGVMGEATARGGAGAVSCPSVLDLICLTNQETCRPGPISRSSRLPRDFQMLVRWLEREETPGLMAGFGNLAGTDAPTAGDVTRLQVWCWSESSGVR